MVSKEYIISVSIDVEKLTDYILTMKHNNIPEEEYNMHIESIAKSCVISNLKGI